MSATLADLLVPYIFAPRESDSDESGRARMRDALEAESMRGGRLTEEDAELLARLRLGDAAALETVYSKHAASLWRHVAQLLHDRDGAEDVVHDIFLTLWDRRERLEVTISLRAYLFAAVRHRALMVLRNRAIAARAAEAADSAVEAARATPLPSAVPAPDVGAHEHDLHAAVVRAVAELPERQRAALELRWLHGLNYTEAAVVLGVSEAAVRKLVDKALVRLDDLRQLLSR